MIEPVVCTNCKTKPHRLVHIGIKHTKYFTYSCVCGKRTSINKTREGAAEEWNSLNK